MCQPVIRPQDFTVSEPAVEHREAAGMRSVRLIRPYGSWLALVLGLLCMLALVDMAAPFFLGLLFDKVFSPPQG